MAFCQNCGTKIDDSVKFCPSCGRAVNTASNVSIASSNSEQILNQPVPDNEHGRTITIQREKAYAARRANMEISVDGKAVGILKNRESLSFNVTKTDTVIQISIGVVWGTINASQIDSDMVYTGIRKLIGGLYLKNSNYAVLPLRRHTKPMGYVYYVFCGVLFVLTMVYLLYTIFPFLSKGNIQNTIKMSFQKTMDTDPNFRDYKMRVKEVIVVKSSSHMYTGIVTVLFNNEEYKVSITATVDGSNVMWEAKPMAFEFLLQ